VSGDERRFAGGNASRHSGEVPRLRQSGDAFGGECHPTPRGHGIDGKGNHHRFIKTKCLLADFSFGFALFCSCWSFLLSCSPRETPLRPRPLRLTSVPAAKHWSSPVPLATTGIRFVTAIGPVKSNRIAPSFSR